MDAWTGLKLIRDGSNGVVDVGSMVSMDNASKSSSDDEIYLLNVNSNAGLISNAGNGGLLSNTGNVWFPLCSNWFDCEIVRNFEWYFSE